MRRAVGFSLVLAGLASACRSIPLSENPLLPVSKPTPLALYQVDWWTKLVTGVPSWEFGPREPATPAVEAETGAVFVGTRDGVLRSVSAPGKVNWLFHSPGKFNAGPQVANHIVYAAAGNGTLYALRTQDGSVVWKYEAGEELGTTPVIGEGKVFVVSLTDVLYALDEKSGKWLWQYRRDSPSGFTIRGASRPAVKDGIAYLGFADGHLVALKLEDGSVKWDKALSSSGQLQDADASPILDDSGNLFAASYKDGVYALDAETGNVRWHAAGQGWTSLVQSGPVLVAAGDEKVAAFLAATGRPLWNLPLPGEEATKPVLARGLLIVPTRRSLLFADSRTASPLVSWNPGRGVVASLAWTGTELYVLSNEGALYAMRLLRRGP